MNKTEIVTVVILFLLLVAWGFFNRGIPSQPVQGGRDTEPASGQTTGVPAEAVGPELSELRIPKLESDENVATQQVTGSEGSQPVEPEKVVTLTNNQVRVYLSSWGAAIRAVELMNYRASRDPDSGPVRLDFSLKPALTIRHLPDFSDEADFNVSLDPTGCSARFERTRSDGLCMIRTVTLLENFRLRIEDSFVNTGQTDVVCPRYVVALGPMQMIESKARANGTAHLGLDTLAAHGGERVRHWGTTTLPGLFGYRPSFFSCERPNVSIMPPTASQKVGQPVSWAAAKNQFFVQILVPEEAAVDCELHASRKVGPNVEFELSTVSADLTLAEFTVRGGGGTVSRRMDLYIGPKKYALLKGLSLHQAEVMEFGRLAGLCKILLTILNGIYEVIPNYGVAIILLTALIRFVFWPITRKSTQSMKKMQDLQPLVTQIRQKYKDKPQKMNQEIMRLYREQKVNPMVGCLPIVIQIPVFIALFNVLRSAIELRFARFLWIRDLSEPENLLSGVLPFGLSLNILPILMTVATVIQQKMTPGSGDRQQDRIMMLMPVIMLFIFYNMASALVLYWTVSQCMTLGGIWWQRKKPAILARLRRS